MPRIAECPAPVVNTASTAKWYEIDDTFTVTAIPNTCRELNIWSPVIPASPYQRVLDMAVAQAPGVWSVGRETEHGNAMIHARLSAGLPQEVTFRIRYLVERIPVAHSLHAACVRPLETPALFDRSLRAEQFVDVDDKTRILAHKIVGAETNMLNQARQIYDYVVSTLTYDAAQQSWKGSTEHALVCSVGNCNDIHALFISLCRSLGIPARLVLGQALEPPAPGQESCELCGYHCWSEFFAPGLGWVPVDASCACKYGTRGLFGNLEMNHIAWSVGRDIQLQPTQQGEPILFFAGPYAEADGRPHLKIRRSVRFTEI
jgi:transglutaminase-like putative cysteine protease